MNLEHDGVVVFTKLLNHEYRSLVQVGLVLLRPCLCQVETHTIQYIRSLEHCYNVVLSNSINSLWDFQLF